MAVKGMGNVTVSYNSNAITNYANQADLNATAEDIETTHFGSTGRESIAGTTAWEIGLGGDWNATVDGYLSPDIITTGTKKTAAIAFTDAASNTVTYTWTSNAEIANWQIQSTPTGKTVWSATLRLSGAPTRGTS